MTYSILPLVNVTKEKVNKHSAWKTLQKINGRTLSASNRIENIENKSANNTEMRTKERTFVFNIK